MSVAERLLSRLVGVRARGPNQWIAKCPAHSDKTPSLSIRETSEGVVLVKCFGGCGAVDVIEAVGITLSDLFPPKIRSHKAMVDRRPIIAWSDVVQALRHHLLVIGLAADDQAHGRDLLPEDLISLSRSARFVLRILDEVSHVRC